MQIRLTTQRVGPHGIHYEGEVIELPADEAVRLLASHQAEPIEPEPRSADFEPPRDASRPPKARKR